MTYSNANHVPKMYMLNHSGRFQHNMQALQLFIPAITVIIVLIVSPSLITILFLKSAFHSCALLLRQFYFLKSGDLIPSSQNYALILVASLHSIRAGILGKSFLKFVAILNIFIKRSLPGRLVRPVFSFKNIHNRYNHQISIRYVR